MKIALACLMCLVFVTSQTFAIKGGPDYGRLGQVTLTGTYSGVLTPTAHVPVSCSGLCPPQPTDLNQLGLFTLSVPQTGLATGSAVFFNQGNVYTGTIQATADPLTAKITGIFSANFPYLLITATGSETVSAQASGNIRARVKNVSTQGTNATRVKGNADIQYELTVNSPFDEILFSVVGFKQG